MDKQVRSFVSFALAMKPLVTINRPSAGDALSDTSVTLKFDHTVNLYDAKLSEAKTTSLETLLQKYEPIKEFLQIAHSPTDVAGFNVSTSSPIVNFQPNVRYHVVQINGDQLEIAKEVARRAELVYNSHSAGDHTNAKAQFDDLQTYVSQKRDELIGDFKAAGRINDVVGQRGVGQAGQPEAIEGGAVVFVIIEIYVM